MSKLNAFAEAGKGFGQLQFVPNNSSLLILVEDH